MTAVTVTDNKEVFSPLYISLSWNQVFPIIWLSPLYISLAEIKFSPALGYPLYTSPWAEINFPQYLALPLIYLLGWNKVFPSIWCLLSRPQALCGVLLVSGGSARVWPLWLSSSVTLGQLTSPSHQVVRVRHNLFWIDVVSWLHLQDNQSMREIWLQRTPWSEWRPVSLVVTQLSPETVVYWTILCVACLFLIIDVVNIASSFTAKQWRKILVNLATRAINILSTINLKAAEVDLFQIFLMSLFIN